MIRVPAGTVAEAEADAAGGVGGSVVVVVDVMIMYSMVDSGEDREEDDGACYMLCLCVYRVMHPIPPRLTSTIWYLR